MTALPAASDFTDSGVTEADFKAAVTALRNYLAGLLDTSGTAADALAKVGALFGRHEAKTSAYTVLTTDRGVFFEASGTWSLTLPAASSAGEGFAFILRNNGSGVITIDPDGAETIDGSSTEDVAAGTARIVACNGTEWRSFPFLVDASVQSTATDTTAGRLMAVGAFGLGTPLATFVPSVTLDTAVEPGLFSYFFSDADAPTGSSGSVQVNRYGTTAIRQTARPLNSLEIYQRHSNDGGSNWSDWDHIYSAANAVGTVSEASGTPTGALMQTGSSANGTFTRFADGTQICSAVLTSTLAGDAVWTFPATFASAPAVLVTPAKDTVARSGTYSGATTTDVGFRVWDDEGNPLAEDTSLMAIGRWF